MNWRAMWRGIIGADEPEYVRRLEAEVGRLRAENRALLNSILGIAGVPPVLVEKREGETLHRDSGQDNQQQKPNRSAVRSGTFAAAMEAASERTIDDDTKASSPLKTERKIARSNTGISAGKIKKLPVKRKRSWQQVTKMLEIDAATKKKRE